MTVPRTRWLAACGITVLAAVAGIALLLQNTGSAACAVPPTGETVHRGKATFYDLGEGTGNCSLPVPADDLFVALGESEYSGAAACGSYLDVTGPKGKVRVKVIDSCPPCEPGHIDLSRTAFGRIADHVTGIVPISYRSVADPPTPGPLTVRFDKGANPWWFALVVDNHGNALQSVEAKAGRGAFRRASRQKHNVWVIEGGAGTGPVTVKITDVYGRTVTGSGITQSPGKIQSLSGAFGSEPAKASPRHSRTPPSPSPSPSVAASASAPDALSPLAPATTPTTVAVTSSAATSLTLSGDDRDCSGS